MLTVLERDDRQSQVLKQHQLSPSPVTPNSANLTPAASAKVYACDGVSRACRAVFGQSIHRRVYPHPIDLRVLNHAVQGWIRS